MRHGAAAGRFVVGSNDPWARGRTALSPAGQLGAPVPTATPPAPPQPAPRPPPEPPRPNPPPAPPPGPGPRPPMPPRPEPPRQYRFRIQFPYIYPYPQPYWIPQYDAYFLSPPRLGWPTWLQRQAVSCATWLGWSVAQKYSHLARWYFPQDAYGFAASRLSDAQQAAILAQIDDINAECGANWGVYPPRGYWPIGPVDGY